MNELLIAILSLIGTFTAALIGYFTKTKIEKNKKEMHENQMMVKSQHKFVDDLQEELKRMMEETAKLRISVDELQRTNIELIFENKNLQITIKALMNENKELQNTVENLMIRLEDYKEG